MFGLLQIMENIGLEEAKIFREKVKNIAGDKYEEILKKVSTNLGDITFEAESFYGDDKDRLGIHMKELIKNFELDVINDELLKTMGDLRQAEKDGKNDVVVELAKKCQVLSIRKAEVGKGGVL
jgi:hypothetical protein